MKIYRISYWLFTDIPMFPIEGFAEFDDLKRFCEENGLQICHQTTRTKEYASGLVSINSDVFATCHE